jgi:pimeloyl-ACP methyl ester carboxylesterase
MLVHKVLPLAAVAAVSVFFWPQSSPDLERLYAKVPKKRVDSLTEFRKTTASKQIKVAGRKWNYLSVGSGTRAVLFLHGMTGAYDIWWNQIDALKSEYRIIAVTYPAVDTLAAMEKGALAVLEAEGVADFDVVGTSLGGYFAQYLVARHPDRVRKAVFSNTFPPNDLIKEKNGTIGGLIPFLPEWVVMNVLRGSFAKSVYPASGNDELTLAFLNEMASGRMTKAQVSGRYKCVVEKFGLPPKTAVPVLIIEAGNDPLVEPALRERLKQAYPDAKTVTVNNGHFPYLGTPEQFTSAIREFLGGT